MNLDREIAEKVMGWKLRVQHDPLDRDDIFSAYDMPDGTYRTLGMWEPSINIQHAMEVEAEMFKLGYEISINREEDGDYEVGFYSEAMNYFPVHDKSLPEAICRAALAALEEQ